MSSSVQVVGSVIDVAKTDNVPASGGGVDLGSGSGVWALTRGADKEG
jgi:hypothetical protein